MEKYLKFNSNLTDIQKINPLFSKAKARILYVGQNRNNTYFTKESVEKSLHTIYNTPVVGEYLIEKDNFGTHGGKIEIQDDSVKYIQTTVPYGVVSSDAEIYWEKVTEKDGAVRDYLVVDGIYLWTGRYEELNVILEHGQMNESMEIEVVNGEFAVIDGVKTFRIDEFTFTGLCILGSDKNGQAPDEHVEPAFESANIEIVYELNNDNFKDKFNQMLSELKFSIEKQGGIVLSKETQVTEEFENTEVETEVVEEQVQDEVETQEFEQEVIVESTDKEVEVEENNTKTFALTHDQLQSQLRQAVKADKYIDRWGDECRKYWFVDSTDTHIIVENVQEGYQLYSFEYEISGDSVNVKFDSAQKVKIEYVPFVEGTFTLNSERFELEKEVLSNELNELKVFKRESEEVDLVSKFADKLSEDEINSVLETSKDFSIEQVEEKLLVLFGKKNFSLVKESEKPVSKVKVSYQKDDEDYNPYKAFFNKK